MTKARFFREPTGTHIEVTDAISPVDTSAVAEKVDNSRASNSVASTELTRGRDLGALSGESGSGKTTLVHESSWICKLCCADRWRDEYVSWGRRPDPPRAPTTRATAARPAGADGLSGPAYGSLDPRSTVRACLDEVLRLHPPADGASRSDRISRLADLVGLSATQLDRTPREPPAVSASRSRSPVALAVEPRIIVLDEAVAALDISIQAQILNLLADLRDELGTAYLLISHDLGSNT